MLERPAKSSVKGSQVWEASKKASDAKPLKELDNLVSIAKEKVEVYGYEDHIYDALITDFDPGMKVSDYDALYNPLKTKLSDIVSEYKSKMPSLKLEGEFLRLAKKTDKSTFKRIRFSFDNGVISESSHPFLLLQWV